MARMGKSVTVFENEVYTIEVFEDDDIIRISYFEDNHFVDDLLIEVADFRNGIVNDFMLSKGK